MPRQPILERNSRPRKPEADDRFHLKTDSLVARDSVITARSTLTTGLIARLSLVTAAS
jgi:hypothetical protein